MPAPFEYPASELSNTMKRRNLREEHEGKAGQTLMEYCIVLSFVSLFVIFAMVRLGLFIVWVFGSLQMTSS
jgi:hypothetical protein